MIKKKHYRVTDERGCRVKKETHDLVCKFAWQCIKELSKGKYDLKLNTARFHLVTRANYQRSLYKTGNSNNPNYVGVHIDVDRYQSGDTCFYEYPSFKKDYRIYGFDYALPSTCLLALVAHEVAHYVQCNKAKYLYRYRDTHKKSHGECFQEIYRWLRVALVNPLIIKDLQNACPHRYVPVNMWGLNCSEVFLNKTRAA